MINGSSLELDKTLGLSIMFTISLFEGKYKLIHIPPNSNIAELILQIAKVIE